jgi:hypothetical protein
MTDLGTTIAPKSDQLNADDLIAGPKTIRVTKVTANPGAPEQPISIYFEGDNNKPYKPGKSMRRVLVQVWGKDGDAYVGRSMTLFRDQGVQFGGIAVGGIRISHMSDIKGPVTLALTATRASRKPYTVQPLEQKAAPTTKPTVDPSLALEAAMRAAKTKADLDKVWLHKKADDVRDAVAATDPARLDTLNLIYESRAGELA